MSETSLFRLRLPFMRMASVCLLLAAVSVRADSFADLKAAVAALRATAPIHATIDIQRSRVDTSTKPPVTVTGTATIDALIDGEGLHIGFAPAMLARSAKEQSDREANNEAPTPTRGAIDQLGPLFVADRLDFSRRLLGLLTKSELTAEKRVALDGHPARLLSFKVHNPPQKMPVGHLDVNEDSLTVWMGDDNVPLAAQHTTRYTGGILFVKAQIAETTRWTFARRDDRLVATRTDDKTITTGFGDNSEETKIITVAVSASSSGTPAHSR